MMRASFTVAFSLAGVGAAIALVVAACLPDPERPPTGGGPASAVPCDAGGAGSLPPPNCDPTPNTCPSKPDPACVIAAKCGDPKTCLPLSDNTTNPNKTLDFRLRRLYVTAPSALTQPVIQSQIVASGINLNAPECAEVNGKGAFNWLLRIDKTAKTLQTGGAPASSDPFTKGFCFFQQNVNGLLVGPVTAKLDFTSDTFSSQPVDQLNVPIFVDPTKLDSVVVLPIKKAVLKNVTLSANGNCIGSFNQNAVAGSSCSDFDSDSCSHWLTAGTIGGFITLEDADAVKVDLLHESLCVLLTKSTPDPKTGGCTRTNGKVDYKGDFCSKSQTAGDCQDAFWLSSTFAASAVTINDGAGIVGCGVTPMPDAGADSGSDSGAKDSTAD